MEQTIGKRIMYHRKKLGLTQDQLAEQLGVTAQAVSKWENDLSCPDISILPQLAGIFQITTDELLGYEAGPQAKTAEIVTEDENDENEPEGIHFNNGHFQFQWDSGRTNTIGLSVLILAVGILTLCSKRFGWGASLWDIIWPTAILIWGIFGLWPRFSFFKLGCVVFGGYFLTYNLFGNYFAVDREYIIPIILILWGISLMSDALRKPKNSRFKFFHRDKSSDTTHNQNTCHTGEADFCCSTTYGEDHYYVVLPRMEQGFASVTFGELVVDLSNVESISDGCTIDASCNFGELVLKVPMKYRVEYRKSSAFASVDVSGEPQPEPEGILYINANVHFGEIVIRYI